MLAVNSHGGSSPPPRTPQGSGNRVFFLARSFCDCVNPSPVQKVWTDFGTGLALGASPLRLEARQQVGHSAVTTVDDAMDELLGGSRVGPSDEILDLDETHECLF